MIVTCERCGTQFQLDDARVPKRGVRVRCSRCKNAFRVLPEAERAAEEIAELARRAREDSQEEITQDLAEDSPGNSRSRAGARRDRRAEKPRDDAPSPSEAGAAGGLLDEESDWKFNEDVAGDLDAAGRPGQDASKPDPPVARSGARNADDWFSGGGNAPLELDDRPWDASAAASEPEASAESPSAPAPSAGLLEHAPSPEAFAAPQVPEALERPQPAAEPAPTDELSGESWDLFAEAEAAEAEAAGAEAAEAASEVERAPASPRVLPALAATASHLGRLLAYGAQAFGWVATAALFGAGLYAGLTPGTRVAPGPERVAGFELAALEGHFVENAVSGALFVVSGRVRNPGPQAGVLPHLELELLDAAGSPLGGERAPLHAPVPTARLREAPAQSLSPQPPLLGSIQPGEERAFEVVLPTLPAEAAAFRIVEARGHRAASGPLPEVELPR